MLATAAQDYWFDLGRSRAPADAPYAGELLPTEAWRLLEERPDALLIDVRTPGEWQAVGIPKLPHARTAMLVSWRHADGSANPQFLNAIDTAAGKDVPLLFICRVGGRSFEAANVLAGRGFSRAFNVTHGFEGDADARGERGTLNGWKADGLAWGRM